MAKDIAAFGEVMMRLQVPGYELLSQAITLSYSFSGTGVNVALGACTFRTYGLSVYQITGEPSWRCCRSLSYES